MALPKRDKKFKVKLPTCSFCHAVGKHYSYTCPDNPKNKCKHCGSSWHPSMNCPGVPKKAIKKESNSTRSKRVATSKLWFQINPPNASGHWICYLNTSPECPRVLDRSTITLEHVKSKVRYPELRYDVTNLKPACSHCNKLKGSLDLDELPMLRSIRVKE